MFWEANLTQREIKKKLVAVVIWAAAFAFVEAAVVVYLRKLFYPEGFAFPLRSELIAIRSESLIDIAGIAILDRAAVFEVGGDTGSPEGVAVGGC